MNSKQNSLTSKSKRTFWQQHIENQISSGLTQAKYCLESGLNKNTFTCWKSKLKQLDSPALFLPVSVQPETDLSSPSGISCLIADRFRIQLDVGFDPDTLLKLINTLESE